MIIIFLEMTPCGSYKNRRFGGSCTLKMEAIQSSETSVLIRATRCHLPEDDNHHLCEFVHHMYYFRPKTENFTCHKYQTNKTDRAWSFIVSNYSYFSSPICVEVQNTPIRWRSQNDRPVTLDPVAFSVKIFVSPPSNISRVSEWRKFL
jgi:hypothetical protein